MRKTRKIVVHNAFETLSSSKNASLANCKIEKCSMLPVLPHLLSPIFF